jgi:transposase
MDTTEKAEPVRVVHARCCGLDVHTKTVQACALIETPEGRVRREERTFSTVVAGLLGLLDWLLDLGCTAVAMESTGVYWKPIYNLLEGHLIVQVVNAQHIKQVPGRKTDVGDAAWIAGLLRHGLLRPSFIPTRQQRQLRDLTRYRRSVIEDRTTAVNRLHKTLQGANIKLASVASDITGKSAREMLALLVAGETDPTVLAQCARGRLKEKIPALEQALASTISPDDRFLVVRQLAHLDDLDAELAILDAEVARRLAPFAEEVALLDTIPGVGLRIAEELIAELGVDMGQFPTADHLASWAGMAPGNHISAGKSKGGKTRKGSRWLRTSLVVAAQAAGRKKEGALAARFRALTARRGKKRAAVAVGRTILECAYTILRTHQPYHEPLPQRPRPAPPPDHLVQQLAALGYAVTIAPLNPAAA